MQAAFNPPNIIQYIAIFQSKNTINIKHYSSAILTATPHFGAARLLKL